VRGTGIFVFAMLTASLAFAQRPAQSPIPSAPAPASGAWRDASMADYRKHLEMLSALVEACAKARDAKACKPQQVGPDDRVALGDGDKAQRRAVRYDWLRALLAKAAAKDTPPAKDKTTADAKKASAADALPPPPTTAELLQAAEVRLADDSAQAGGRMRVEPNYATQHTAMEQVLSERAFSGLEQTSPFAKIAEEIDNWLNSLFAGAARFGARSPWLGLAVEWGFILAVCLGLVWGLVQLERRWRIRLTPEGLKVAPEAASARDWQLWLEDARKAAAAGQWREAIHFVYWAAISRLESRRLWPADRARTPREYLALLGGEDPRRTGLAALTGSFERTWYGGRAADESEYREAEELAAALIAGGGGGLSGGGRVR
jgi:Domain of unknown function (DUF4129)